MFRSGLVGFFLLGCVDIYNMEFIWDLHTRLRSWRNLLVHKCVCNCTIGRHCTIHHFHSRDERRYMTQLMHIATRRGQHSCCNIVPRDD